MGGLGLAPGEWKTGPVPKLSWDPLIMQGGAARAGGWGVGAWQGGLCPGAQGGAAARCGPGCPGQAMPAAMLFLPPAQHISAASGLLLDCAFVMSAPCPGPGPQPLPPRPCPPVAGAAHTPTSKVLVPLSKGAAALPELHVTDSSEAMLSGRKPPFRLLVRAVRAGQALPNIRHCVSEGFVVATRRTRTAGKVRQRGRDRGWGCEEEGKAGDEERGEGRGGGSARAAACQFGRVESEARRMSPRFCFFCASPTLAWMKWGRGGAAGCYPTPLMRSPSLQPHLSGGDPQCGRSCEQAGAHGQGDCQEAAGVCGMGAVVG